MTITAALTQPLRDEHRELLPTVEMLRSAADLVGAATNDRVCGLLDDVHEFLVELLIPHGEAEERVLYPIVEAAMRAPGATRIMGRDHVAIVRLADELGWLRGHLHDSTVTRDQAMALRRVLYGLHAIVKLHVEKADKLYLPVLDRWLTVERARTRTSATGSTGRTSICERSPGFVSRRLFGSRGEPGHYIGILEHRSEWAFCQGDALESRAGGHLGQG